MVRRAPDDAAGSDAGGEAGESDDPERLTPPSPPAQDSPFAQAFVPQFEEVATVLDRLSGFALVPVEVPSRDVGFGLWAWLAGGRPVTFVGGAVQWRALPAAIVAATPGADGVVVVVGPSETDEALRAGLSLLNQKRDRVADDLRLPLVWCGTAGFLRATAEMAPDFWSVRELPLRIDVPPTLGQAPLEGANWLFRLPRLHLQSAKLMLGEATLAGLSAILDTSVRSEERTQSARSLLLAAERSPVTAEQVERALRVVREAGDARELAHSLRIAGAVADRLGDRSLALSRWEEARRLFAFLGDRAGKARMSFLLGSAIPADNPSKAEEYLSEALRGAREIDDLDLEGDILIELGSLASGDDYPDRIRNAFERARACFERVGNPYGLALSHLGLASVRQRAAEVEVAAEEWDAAAKLFRSLGEGLMEAVALVENARCHLVLGRVTESRALLKRAAEFPSVAGDAAWFKPLLAHVVDLPDEVAPERDALIARLKDEQQAIHAD
ncbi:MAG: hypothetical protein R3B70_30060 [Polyangiaceae bacterium]